MTLQSYVMQNTVRGECKCGRCIDVGNAPDPTGHTVNLCFFKVALQGTPTVEEFIRLTKSHDGEYGPCNPLDGQEHSYMELGGWLGSQELAFLYMGMGTLLGVFHLMTPQTMLGMADDDPMVMQIAGAGLVCVQAKRSNSGSPETSQPTKAS